MYLFYSCLRCSVGQSGCFSSTAMDHLAFHGYLEESVTTSENNTVPSKSSDISLKSKFLKKTYMF